jgi:transcriptional regulator with XRE-family HTH domain
MNEQDVLTVLGGNIKHYRNRSGLSQFELAEKINMSVPFLSELETGKSWISPATLLKFSSAFGLEIHELLKSVSSPSARQASLLDKYTEDAHRLLDKLRGKYRHKKFRAG